MEFDAWTLEWVRGSFMPTTVARCERCGDTELICTAFGYVSSDDRIVEKEIDHVLKSGCLGMLRDVTGEAYAAAYGKTL